MSPQEMAHPYVPLDDLFSSDFNKAEMKYSCLVGRDEARRGRGDSASARRVRRHDA